MQFLYCLVYTAIVKELDVHRNYWKEKQEEIENYFKSLYKPMKPSKGTLKTRGCRKPKKVDNTNEELSSYAGSLTRELLVKV